MCPISLSLSLFVIIAVSFTVEAVQYQVVDNAMNTAGSARFEREIGIPYAQQTLQVATEFIWQIFKQQSESDRKNIDQVKMMVSIFTGAAAVSANNVVFLSSDYIQRFKGDIRAEVVGIIYHEATHVWQWNGNGEAPKGLTEGIADYVRLKAGFQSFGWAARGSGVRWDQGYYVTAYFLEYCNWVKEGFVADLNALMKDHYSHDFFMKLLGKSVDQLWHDYKSHFGN